MASNVWFMVVNGCAIVFLLYLFLKHYIGAVRLHLSTVLLMAFVVGLMLLNVTLRTKMWRMNGGLPQIHYTIPFPVGFDITMGTDGQQPVEQEVWRDLFGTPAQCLKTIALSSFQVLLALALIAGLSEYVIYRRARARPPTPQASG